jgi:hypothetical protein
LGATLAKAFDMMLRRHGLEDKVLTTARISGPQLTTYVIQILAINADNASSNDTMTTVLDGMPNAFDEVNRVWCFNHTLQLSAKTLIWPFNAGFSSGNANDVDDVDSDDGDGFCKGEGSDDGEEDAVDKEDGPNDYAEDDDDVLADLDPDKRAELMEDTAAIRAIVSKVHLIPSCTALTMNTYPGPTTLLCNHSFIYYCTAGMASRLQGPSHEAEIDSP